MSDRETRLSWFLRGDLHQNAKNPGKRIPSRCAANHKSRPKSAVTCGVCRGIRRPILTLRREGGRPGVLDLSANPRPSVPGGLGRVPGARVDLGYPPTRPRGLAAFLRRVQWERTTAKPGQPAKARPGQRFGHKQKKTRQRARKRVGHVRGRQPQGRPGLGRVRFH